MVRGRPHGPAAAERDDLPRAGGGRSPAARDRRQRPLPEARVSTTTCWRCGPSSPRSAARAWASPTRSGGPAPTGRWPPARPSTRRSTRSGRPRRMPESAAAELRVKAVVTGAAGFIGSHLTESLLADGHEVTGVDAFTDYYARSAKERNLEGPRAHRAFRLVEGRLQDLDLRPVLEGASQVFHLAAQAGVRASWGREFTHYTDHNVLATQRLLEAARAAGGPRVVYASSSSVYGDAPSLPLREDARCEPVSPLRGDQAGGGAPGRAVREELRPARGQPSLLHRLRTPPAAGHGVPPVPEGGARRGAHPRLRGRRPDPRLHLRVRHRGRHPRRRQLRAARSRL